MSSQVPAKEMKHQSPNRANDAAIADLLRNGEGLLEFGIWMRCNGFLDEHRNAGEMLEDLELDVAPRLRASTEHGR